VNSTIFIVDIKEPLFDLCYLCSPDEAEYIADYQRIFPLPERAETVQVPFIAPQGVVS
jgi:hypothetical protein